MNCHLGPIPLLTQGFSLCNMQEQKDSSTRQDKILINCAVWQHVKYKWSQTQQRLENNTTLILSGVRTLNTTLSLSIKP